MILEVTLDYLVPAVCLQNGTHNGLYSHQLTLPYVALGRSLVSELKVRLGPQSSSLQNPRREIVPKEHEIIRNQAASLLLPWILHSRLTPHHLNLRVAVCDFDWLGTSAAFDFLPFYCPLLINRVIAKNRSWRVMILAVRCLNAVVGC